VKENTYIPGVCNIGPKEISLRRRVGWIGLLVSVILFILLYIILSNPLFRLIIFFPAALSAIGFLQAHFHFCSGYAQRGIFNFEDVGKTHGITNQADRAKDKVRGKNIIIYGVIIGAVVALICIFV
jgi:hypothetical protein